MNDLIHHLSIPAELKSFAEDTCLLPGESRREFENIRCMIIDDVRPKTHIESLWILDLVEMSWEILLSLPEAKVLESYRQAAIEAILQRLDGSSFRRAPFG
jgi:hypothetical protein